MWPFTHWRRRRLLQRTRVPEHLWEAAFAQLPLLNRLDPSQRRRLRELTVIFLHEKSLEPAAGLVLDDHMRLVIGLQACLPILELGLDWYDGWSSVVVYPGGFAAEHDYIDADGIAHRARHALSGEAWLHGPMVLSWSDAAIAGAPDGVNLVIHECAHKLDMLDGGANGRPPLHRNMDPTEWTRSFSAAYADFCRRTDAGEYGPIDDYAAESPAEFFAVLSEVFFELPDELLRAYPRVYDQMKNFYRQDPRA